MKTIFVWMPSWSWFPYPDVIFNIRDQEMPADCVMRFNMDSLSCWQVVHRARNDIVRRFLELWFDYLWFCDDDNPPSTDVLKYLIEADKDAVSALVPLRHWALWWTVNLNLTIDGKSVTSLEWLPDLFEIENFWTGCVLLSRKIVKDVFEYTKWLPYMFWTIDFVFNSKDWIREIYEDQDKHEWWEEKYINVDGKITKISWEVWEDLYFWVVAKKLWYKFYADKRARCIHYRNKPEFISVINK